MSMRQWGVLAACCVMSVASSGVVAHAQTSDATAASTEETEAHSRFEAGRLAFAAGRYEDALHDFELAYALSHRPELLYNVGQCADRLRMDARALEAFEGYLREAGDHAQYRTEVEAHVVRDGAAAASVPEVEPEAVVATPPPSTASSSSADPLPWIVIGTSAAVAIAGAVMLGIAESDRATVENAPMDARWSAVADAASRGPILEPVGIACLAVGVAGAVIGVVLATLPGPTPDRSVAVRIGPGSIAVQGTLP